MHSSNFAGVRAWLEPQRTAHSDFESTMASHWSGTALMEGGFGHHEKMWASHGRRGNEAAAQFAVAALAARLGTVAASAHERALVEAAASVAAPALVAFVLWVLQRAEKMKLQRLYFVSRDGQIMLKIARILAGPLQSRCELRYLCGSRASWCPPSFAEFDNALLDWLLPPGSTHSVRSGLARLHLAPEPLQEDLLRCGFEPSAWEHELSPNEAKSLRCLLQGQPFQQRMRAQAAQGQPLLLKYLQQEGLLDDVPWAMVDIGWHGTLQDALGRLLAGAGGRAPHGFYCGASGPPDNAQGGAREAYFADTRAGHEPCGHTPSGHTPDEVLARLVTPLEAFCMADHGQVLGYVQQDGKVQPVLGDTASDGLAAWGLPLVQETICRFARELARDGLSYPAQDLRPLALEGIRRFWSSPRPAEARAWGSLPCEDEGQRYLLAEGYSARQLACALASGSIERSHFHSWHAGSLACTCLPVRLPFALLTHAAHAAQSVRRLCRRLR